MLFLPYFNLLPRREPDISRLAFEPTQELDPTDYAPSKRSISVQPGGDSVICWGYTEDYLAQYDLSVPYDLTSGSLTYDGFSGTLTGGQGVFTPSGVFYFPRGVAGGFDDNILINNGSTTTPFRIGGTNSSAADIGVARDYSAIVWADEGNAILSLERAPGYVRYHTLAAAYDLSSGATVTEDTAKELDVEALLPALSYTPYFSGLSLSSSGRKMFISELSVSRLFQFTLSIPYDPSTATYDDQYILEDDTGGVEVRAAVLTDNDRYLIGVVDGTIDGFQRWRF